MTTGVWFRNALRLHDNLPLLEAAVSSNSVICFYIFTPTVYSPDYMGINRLYFLLQSLEDLKSRLKKQYNGDLIIFNTKKSCKDVFSGLLNANVLKEVYYEYDSTPYGKARDSKITEEIDKIQFKVFHGHTFTKLPDVVAAKGFKNPGSMSMMENILLKEFGKGKSRSGIGVPSPLDPPDQIHFDSEFLKRVRKTCPDLEILDEVPKLKDLSKVFGPLFDNVNVKSVEKNNYFHGGETEALERLQRKVLDNTEFVCKFKKPETACITTPASEFKEPSTTGLSPYLALGCLSVRKLWHGIDQAYERRKNFKIDNLATSLYGQLLFREMFYILNEAIGPVFALNDKNNPAISKYVEWDKKDPKLLKAWENGQTGYPFIDALMRQMKSTGWMHHLGRHAVSCFLTRGQLYQNWTHGRDVFDRELVDSDYALNTGNWLWLSGVATFSMPYFRVYSPCPTEDKKSALNFNAGGNDFIRHWVPELKKFPAKFLTKPWECPKMAQTSCGIIIGEDYPMPIVPLKNDNLSKFKRSLQDNKSSSAPPNKKKKI